MYRAVCRAELAVDNVVEDGLEVVEEDGVGGAFENKGKAPVRVNTAAGCNTSGRNGGIR